MLEYLGDTRVGCIVPSGRARVDKGRGEEEVLMSEARGRGGRAGPAIGCFSPLFLFFVSFL